MTSGSRCGISSSRVSNDPALHGWVVIRKRWFHCCAACGNTEALVFWPRHKKAKQGIWIEPCWSEWWDRYSIVSRRKHRHHSGNEHAESVLRMNKVSLVLNYQHLRHLLPKSSKNQHTQSLLNLKPYSRESTSSQKQGFKAISSSDMDEHFLLLCSTSHENVLLSHNMIRAYSD